MSDLPRRRLLAVSGTALTGAIAGCSGSDDGDDEPTPNGGDESDDSSDSAPEDSDTGSSTELEGTTLGEITIDNLDETAHTVDVIVEFDREIEDWTTESLEADSGVTLDRNWPTEPGQFRVTTRLDQAELVQVTPDEWNDPSCLNLFVRVDRDGELTLLSDIGGGPCGAGDADVDDAET
ncbi:hypothetical protein [Natronorubrum aibiense]|uniref:Uncharacterized protein n=1 Tax=Natronorubrum aibiense TaxID=348826 RepID=A0A5P9P276_9EURY|nr:hypothetical protein [Natronorubrum aibiense]QFU82233.1 hypothetical protein GCU68_06655 [Natronorubrum aibiense]